MEEPVAPPVSKSAPKPPPKLLPMESPQPQTKLGKAVKRTGGFFKAGRSGDRYRLVSGCFVGDDARSPGAVLGRVGGYRKTQDERDSVDESSDSASVQHDYEQHRQACRRSHNRFHRPTDR